jgi:antitoxin component of MazEF toxin-antitoxin module
MGRKSLADRFKRTLTQVGGKSLSVTLPIEYLEELGWKKGQELKLKLNKRNRRIVIEEVVEEE